MLLIKLWLKRVFLKVVILDCLFVLMIKWNFIVFGFDELYIYIGDINNIMGW